MNAGLNPQIPDIAERIARLQAFYDGMFPSGNAGGTKSMRPVIVNGVQYESVSAASAELGIDSSGLRGVIAGTQRMVSVNGRRQIVQARYL